MAGNSFTLNIQDSSGLILVGSGWTKTSISSSVYSAAPVAVYQVDQVLIPEAIFGAPPPLSPSQSPPPPNVPSSPSKGQTPPSDNAAPSDNAPSPQPLEATNNKSASHRIGFGVATCLVSVSSSVFMTLLGFAFTSEVIPL
ncbi:uncharacterized protein A4U43_C05F30390 [Asparagus officinalis]|uniref:FAS1 domain-containing protein n=1 Tax=Asparagus officinalis TaxID=4686 RepID=A0A5P1EXD9_ASPOF|nr:uncharacterized protein A4U43_C05F30390 [Asparagus officinalis]